jgi:hypothetical protein
MRKTTIRRLGRNEGDPLEGVANLFDLGIVFALGFMVAVIASMGLPELFVQQDVTLVKNPGTSEMQVIQKKGQKIEHYKVSQDELGGEGERLGVAYRLKSGEVIYVPEPEASGMGAGE